MTALASTWAYNYRDYSENQLILLRPRTPECIDAWSGVAKIAGNIPATIAELGPDLIEFGRESGENRGR